MKRARYRKGFTLIEVGVVVALMMLMLAITAGSIFRGQRRTSFSEAVNGIVRDIRQQQIRVMQGDAAGGVLSDYSIHFEADRYVLYPGVVYDSGNPNNQVVLLDPSIRISAIQLPDAGISFARGSGDVRNYTDVLSSVTVYQSETNSQTTLRINAHGVVFIE